jgi:hypothetical protein
MARAVRSLVVSAFAEAAGKRSEISKEAIRILFFRVYLLLNANL